MPAASRRTGGHPAKRTFQALRIEVNGELDGPARRRVPAAIDALAVGGRIVVLAYHSLEDRIVKRELAERGPVPDAAEGLPVELPGHGPELRLVTRGAEIARDERDRRQPAGRLGAAAGRRTDPGGRGVSERIVEHGTRRRARRREGS